MVAVRLRLLLATVEALLVHIGELEFPVTLSVPPDAFSCVKVYNPLLP